MTTPILSAVSAPATSLPFSVSDPNRSSTVFMRNDAPPGDLTAGDSATVQISHDDGITWVDMIKDGTLVQLTDQNNHESIYALGLFRLKLTNVTGPLSAYFNG